MERYILSILCPIYIALMLCSCSSLSPNDPREERIAICNELKSKLIFKGNTSNTRNSEIENSEATLLQRQYDKYHCDQL